MKKTFIFSLTAVLFLSALTGCCRNRRREQTPQDTAQPAAQATLEVPPTSAPVVEATASQAPPTDVPTVQPIDTVAPTQGASQSDAIADQLDTLLGQFDSQLQSVDTIPETP